MEWIYELIALIKDNWLVVKDNFILFILFGVICFSLGLLIIRIRYLKDIKSAIEQRKIEKELEEVLNENKELCEQVRDLSTTKRMLRDDSGTTQTSIGKKIADTLNK